MTQGMAGRGRAAGVALLVMLGAWFGATTAAHADGSSVLGQWRFDEGSGQRAIDDGTFGLDGRLGTTDGADSADPTRITGASGGALHFDGNTFVRLPPASELAPRTLTLETVVRAGTSPGPYRYVVSHGAEGCIAGSYGLYTGKDGGIAFYVFDGHSFQVSAAAEPSDVWNGAWHHIAGVYDGSSVRLYVDGRAVGDPYPATLAIAYGLTSSDSYFGSYQGTCALPLTGDVDLVRLWDGPLAAGFIGNLSDAALAPPSNTVAPPAGGPAPTTIPTASDSDSDADAPASRPGLAPVAGGTSIPTSLNAADGTTATAPPPRAGAPARACVIKPSVSRIRESRLTVVDVTVKIRNKPAKSLRVRATYGLRRHQLTVVKTAKNGRAPVRLRPHSLHQIRLTVISRPDCAPVTLTVVKAKKG